ncbi:elongation factor P hydroxylase [Catenovulum sp. SX2]|uniref:elongation factor P hydroxylase n=1 Tax=Catenovulum sp. SX2 TaxID=3398614 RepID=UPI003F8340DB
MHDIQDIIQLFNQTFLPSYNTELVKGDDEPIYYPATDTSPAKVVFAHGYYASALHEIAHWCLAGSERRQQVDYGYWYNPDGRNEQQQKAFEQVEIKPQAIEWILSVAAGFNFKVSCDNLNGSYQPDRHEFRSKIRQQVESYLTQAMPERLNTFALTLSQFYQIHNPFCLEKFVAHE